MDSIVETITPKIAAKYLEHANPDNRTVRTLTSRYAKTMEAGMWLLTHQGVAFDEDGMLIDGHHRLRAVVASGVTVRMSVSRNVPYASLQGVDRGGIRNMRQVAKMIDNAPCRDALECARQWRRLIRTQSGAPADFEVWDTAKRLEPYWNNVAHITKMTTASGRIRLGVRIGAIIIQMGDPARAPEFVTELVSASNREIVGSDGTRNLLRWIDRLPKNGGAQQDAELAGAMVRGFEQWREGGKHNHIKVFAATVIQTIKDCDKLLTADDVAGDKAAE